MDVTSPGSSYSMARLSRVAGYTMSSLLGESFYNLVHAEDIHNVQTAFRNCKWRLAWLESR